MVPGRKAVGIHVTLHECIRPDCLEAEKQSLQHCVKLLSLPRPWGNHEAFQNTSA